MCVWYGSQYNQKILPYAALTDWLLSAFAKSREAILASSCLFVCPSAWNNSAVIGCILIKFRICVFFVNLSIKFKFDQNLTMIGYFT
jgi:hypothetical protein